MFFEVRVVRLLLCVGAIHGKQESGVGSVRIFDVLAGCYLHEWLDRPVEYCVFVEIKRAAWPEEMLFLLAEWLVVGGVNFWFVFPAINHIGKCWSVLPSRFVNDATSCRID